MLEKSAEGAVKYIVIYAFLWLALWFMASFIELLTKSHNDPAISATATFFIIVAVKTGTILFNEWKVLRYGE